MNPFPIVLLGLLANVQAPSSLTLSEALARAGQNRPAICAAHLRVQQAQRTRLSLAAYPAPRLDVQATSNPALRGNDDDLVLAQPIDLFGRRAAGRELGDAGVALAEAGVRQARVEVQADVVEQYAEAAAADLLARNAQDQLAIVGRLESLTRSRVDAGDVSEVQLRRVRIELEKARQTVALRESERNVALRRLAGAIGVPAEGLAIADFAPIATPPFSPETLRRQRADLLALEAQRRVASANVRSSRLGFRPEVEVSGRTSPWTYGRENQTGLRLTVSIPLFDTGRVRNEVRAAESQAAAEEAALADALQRAQAEVEAVAVELRAAEAGIAAFEGLLASSRELVRLSEIGYAEGASPLLEVLEANRSLREVEQGLVEARLRQARAQAAYLQATGTLLEAGS